jgi:hypothetical protein
MKRILIFRFHKLPGICLERIDLLRQFNPKHDIYGLFGGEADQLKPALQLLGPKMSNIFSIADHAPGWKWRFSDLALHEWFVNLGTNIAFDIATVVEWDLVFLKSVDELYSHVSAESIGLTGVRAIKDIESDWAPTAMEPFSIEWQNLLSWARTTRGYSNEPLACLGPGCSIPRVYFERYGDLHMPEWSTDELRLPLSAQLLGIPIADTRLCRSWFLDFELEIFNTFKREVLPSTITRELRIPNGRRCFHPFRTSLSTVSRPAIP